MKKIKKIEYLNFKGEWIKSYYDTEEELKKNYRLIHKYDYLGFKIIVTDFPLIYKITYENKKVCSKCGQELQ